MPDAGHTAVVRRLMRTVLVLPLFLLAIAMGGCGGSDDSAANEATTDKTTTVETTAPTDTESVGEEPTEDLGDFYTRRIDYEFKGQFGRSWDELHPGQQALVPRTRYEECRDETLGQVAGVELKSLRVLETYEDPIDVIGVPEKTSKAVTVRITLAQGEQEESYTDTFHAVPIEGEWKWVLPPADVRAFRQGNCPT